MLQPDSRHVDACVPRGGQGRQRDVACARRVHVWQQLSSQGRGHAPGTDRAL